MSYIHPDDETIKVFIENHIKDRSSIRDVCRQLFRWFDENVRYSRLNAPFFPLQRSDLDVLAMRSGTCGDYSNLLVSVFVKLGYEAQYAYIHKDCYGDEQDHICAAVKADGKWVLVDATQPYRKWHGFDCKHRDYELLAPDAFEARMKKEEEIWTETAKRYGDEKLAGLLYAPWIHEEMISQTDETLEGVFFLLLTDRQKNFTTYAYYQKYTQEYGVMPVMCSVANGVTKYRFSVQKPASIWDNGQWSEEYSEADIPNHMKTEELEQLKCCVARVMADIKRVIGSL